MSTRSSKAAAASAAADELTRISAITKTAAKRSASTAELRFDREVKALGLALKDLDADLRSSVAADLVNQKLEKVNEARDTAMALLDIAITKDEDGCDFEEFTTKQELIDSEACKMASKVLKALSAARDATSANNVAPSATGANLTANVGAALINDTVKPDTLSGTSTPAEMALWKESLKSWFATSGIAKLEVEHQMVFAKSTVAKTLLLKIDWQFNSKTPVFGDDNSLVSAVEAEFEILYPLFLRRLEFYNFSRKDSVEPSVYLAQVAKLAKEAKIDAMSYDDRLIMRSLSGLRDPKLLQKILAMEEPTWATVRQKVTDLEVVKNSAKPAEAEVTSSANRISANPGRFDKKATGNADSQSAVRTPDDLKGKCNVCGSDKHRRADCKHRETAECRACKKKGHMVNVCLDKFYRERGRSQQSDQTKAKSVETETAPAAAVRSVTQEGWTSWPRDWADQVEEEERRTLVKAITEDSETEMSDDEYFSAEEAEEDGPFADLAELAKLAGRNKEARAERCLAVYSERPSIPTPTCNITYEDATGHQFEFKTTPDTGAWRTFIAEDVLTSNGVQFDAHRTPFATAANGGKMTCSGTAFLKATRGDKCCMIKAAVSPSMTNEISTLMA